jgi:hypothetical protein
LQILQLSKAPREWPPSQPACPEASIRPTEGFRWEGSSSNGGPVPREYILSQPATPAACSRASEAFRDQLLLARLPATNSERPLRLGWVDTSPGSRPCRPTNPPHPAAVLRKAQPGLHDWPLPFFPSEPIWYSRGTPFPCTPSHGGPDAQVPQEYRFPSPGSCTCARQSTSFQGSLQSTHAVWGCKHGACLTPVQQRLWLPAFGRGLAPITVEEKAPTSQGVKHQQVNMQVT